jgi:hypothetical protein
MQSHLKKTILDEIEAASEQYPYEAVDVLWVALVKIANTFPGQNEHHRMVALVESMPLDAVREILQYPALDNLLNLDPPLEAVLADPHEQLYSEATQKAVVTIQSKRESDPRLALIAVGQLLKRIRNKRAHGFKSRKGPRDTEVLGAAKLILLALCRRALETESENQTKNQ